MSDSSSHHSKILDQFTQQASGYAQLTATNAPARGLPWPPQLCPQPDELALDVCCGPGHLALALAPHVKQVIGLDLTPAMLEQAASLQAQKGMENVRWVTGDINALTFPDAHFSIVVCSAAFHHLPDPRAAFSGMVRVCRSGGRILVKDVTPDADKVAHYDRFERLRDPSHVHALTIEEFRSVGDDLPLERLTLVTSLAGNLPLDAILRTSFPVDCTRDDLYEMLREDAASGEDRFGLKAALVDGEVRVSYSMTSALWRKT